jgi:serine/threonine protein kinase/tetratricopeptide (TPR) repeat protein
MKSLSDLSVEQCLVIDQLADQFENAILAGQRPSIENVLVANSSLRPYLLKELLAIEIELRRSAGEWPSKEEYLLRFPDDPLLVEAVLNPVPNLASTADPSRENKVEEEPPPERLDRYVIQRQLGRGGFGVVYLAHDEQLNRPVAIKVPHAKLISVPEEARTYLAEARTVANLDHPGIVPVHDVGSTAKYPCYVVSKYVPGTDLATKLKQKRLGYVEAAVLVATVADALHYAHKQGLVHRDVKPGNILIGNDGKPYVVDFGLALRDEDIGKGPKFAGTPAYMSPEQVRGEGHRVDGRSDIFSLGVVFYELLAGRRPFRGDTKVELFEQVTSYEAKPLRQYDEKLPKELERICHKAMAKRASERFSSAHDMAEELRLFLAEQKMIQSGMTPSGVTSANGAAHVLNGTPIPISSSAGSSAFTNLGSSNGQSIKIVPKGLRSFDAHDADFFLELLPGPRDRNGLPDSLRFWKTRIEETDPDNTFKVGLIYGPSGCGKSSLVKAGLLPRLSEEVISVYIEATPGETETRLLNGLRKRCPALEDNLTLKETLAALRRSQGIPVGKKVLVVLDQFEQWLHAKKEEENTDLVQALRQCDGGRVQCIVMVRDDFWMAATRFMRELEVRLVEAQNSAAVDLFPIRHAEKVLAAFGRAFGAIPDNLKDLNDEQKAFLKHSVAGLAEEGKIVCVRLALFAEMMKGKSWTPTTLKEVGGTKGVGVAFLEETFSATTSPPEHRYHQKSARAVLRNLLPNSDTGIKGEMKSRNELLAVSGYANRPKDFDDLLRILDSEIRLITPTDPEGKDTGNDFRTQTQAGQKYFQLTHDYLVPSLRDWLTRKQRETRKGRAELKLAERAATWSDKRENKQLPTLSEWFSIRTLTESNKWTVPERNIMQRATRVHCTWWGGMLLATLLLGFGVQHWISSDRWRSHQDQTRAVAESLQNTLGPSIPVNLKELEKLPKDLVLPELQTRFASATNPRHKLSLAFALAHYGQLDADYLVSRLDDIAESDTGNYITALKKNAPVSLKSIQSESAKCVDKSLWRHKAKLAIVALNLGNTVLASDMCAIEDRPDPEQRTLFIDEFPRWENRLKELHELVTSSDTPSLRSGICLGVGQIAVDKLSDTDKERWQSLASRWFVEKGDTTTHSATGWLLRRWGIAEPKAPDRDKIVSQRDWFVNSVGATMLRMQSYSSVDLLDPLERFRNQLSQISQLAALEPETRMKRAIARYQVGNIESSLEDLDWLLLHGESVPLPEILQYRTLALARLGKADEARESLLQQKVSFGNYGNYMEIQVPAWLGDYTEATRQLESAIGAPTKGENYRYKVACAASLCSKAAFAKSPEQSKQFADRAIEILGELIRGGYSKKQQLQEDPDFENLHDDVRFASLIMEMGRIAEFWVSDREVSRGQFELFIADASYPEKEKPFLWEGANKTISPTADHPTQQVSWYDSVMFCNWLSLHEGRKPCYERTGTKEKGKGIVEFDSWRLIPGSNGYRLLREVEWEIACRAGTKTEFSMGNDESMLVSYCQMYPSKLASVCGDKLPNGWGLHDVHGNVSEWCEDFDVTGTFRGFRGGNWLDNAGYCRSALRSRQPPSKRYSNYGFRVALNSADKLVDALSLQLEQIVSDTD